MKVLIVDDEALVRIGLKSMINWEAHGFELIGEANDGKKALEMIKDKLPDIVITDLKMPVVDGLALIQLVKEENTQISIIVLSSYDDFSLVREAMKLGAEDYLLKLEVEPAQLIKTLQGIKEKILKQRHQQERRDQLHKRIESNLAVIRRAFLKNALLGSDYPANQFREEAEGLDIQFGAEGLFCLLLRVGNAYRFENMSIEEVSYANNALINLCEEIALGDFGAICFSIKANEFVLILFPKRKELQSRLAVDTCVKLVEMLKQYLDIAAVVGVGKGAGDLLGLRQAYDRAKTAIKYRFFKNSEHVILWEEVQMFPDPKDAFSISPLKPKLEKAIFHHKAEELESCLSSLSKELESSNLSQTAVCQTLLELWSIICEAIDHFELRPEEVLTQSYRSYHELLNMENLFEVRNWIKELSSDLLDFFLREQGKDYPRMIAQAKQYIKENHSLAISLTRVADSVGLTPSYFSTIFKQRTGVSYSDYLTKVRIEKAKELLNQTDQKVYEISHMVGYPNHYYFNRIFKKMVGATPLDYRNRK